MEITNEIKSRMAEIIKEKEIKTVFQPVVNLKNGTIFGYEALSRITLKKCSFTIGQAFEIARKMKRLLDFEIICRKSAVKSAVGKPQNAKLFLNFDPNIICEDEYKSGVTAEKLEPFAIIYFDLDNFKAYNDAYGFTNGDMMIKAVAETLTEYCLEQDFCGHVGGDDFVVITVGDRAESFCSDAFGAFAQKSRELYSESDRERGFIVSKNRSGAVENFPLASLSAAAITNREHRFNSLDELSLVIAKTKKQAKQKSGNSLVVV